jgi:hypothetical protein
MLVISPYARKGYVDHTMYEATPILKCAMEKYHLKAVLLKVTESTEEVATLALGESMTGVPATVDMHFRNGAALCC